MFYCQIRPTGEGQLFSLCFQAELATRKKADADREEKR